jgi:asparagine synthetase B (glutamine-hydrolysing)
MCGICGIYSLDKIDEDTAERFQKIMVNCESRGTDAFGYAIYPNNTIFKTKDSVSKGIEKSGNFFKEFTGNKIVLAHTRATTKGSPEKNQNNHPFETKDFILAHNGVIYNDDEFGFKSDIETDSYVIVRNIQELYDKNNNIVEAIKETAEKLRGSYACWLLVKSTGSVYLFRHSNPIDVIYDPIANCVAFASEKNMLAPLIKDMGLKGFYGGFGHTTIEEEKIYRLSNNGVEELGTFEANDTYFSSSCYSIGSYKKSNNNHRYKSEQEMVEDMFLAYELDWTSLVNTLDYYGINAFFKDGHINLYFRETDIFDTINKDMSAMGYTISPKHRTLRVPSVDDFVTILDILQDYNETLGKDFCSYAY